MAELAGRLLRGWSATLRFAAVEQEDARGGEGGGLTSPGPAISGKEALTMESNASWYWSPSCAIHPHRWFSALSALLSAQQRVKMAGMLGET